MQHYIQTYTPFPTFHHFWLSCTFFGHLYVPRQISVSGFLVRKTAIVYTVSQSSSGIWKSAVFYRGKVPCNSHRTGVRSIPYVFPNILLPDLPHTPQPLPCSVSCLICFCINMKLTVLQLMQLMFYFPS